MFKNYLRSNLRALWKNRGQSLINVLGLAMGIICTVVIFITVKFELSFDKYQDHYDRIYRIVTKSNQFGKTDFTSGITYVLPDAVRKDFPDVEMATIVDQNESPPVIGIARNDGHKELFKETDFAFVDPEYFNLFHYEWLESSPSDGLTRDKTVILTESQAKKYFGQASALNRVLSYNSEFDLTVSGVVKDPPLNSDFPFKLFISTKLGANKHGWDNWGSTSSGLNCYVLLKEMVNAEDFQKKMVGWHLKYFTGTAKESGEARTYFLQPLSGVHFDTRFPNFGKRVVSHETLWALSLIGLLLFITACINFVNLNTVLIVNRAREVGVRKVLGSRRTQLVAQFLGETFMVTMIAMILSLAVLELVMSWLSPVLGFQLEFHPWSDKVVLVFLVCLPLLVTLLAGLYPSLSLAGFQPIKALKSKVYSGTGEGVLLRRSLITFQLVISQGLVICTIIIIQQLNLFMHQPLGLSSSAVVEFDVPVRAKIDLELLKERLRAIPGVENASMSNTGSIGSNQWGGDFEATVKGQLIKENADVKFADDHFLKTYGLTLLAGKDLVRSDSVNMFVVNETFVHALGMTNPEDALGTPVTLWGRKALVQGVVKDFNANSLMQKISPTLIMSDKGTYFVTAVKLDTREIKGVMGQIERVWKETFPDFVFEYNFLDDTIGHFYDSERRTSELVTIFAGVAIFIGSMGLLGLVSFMVTRRTKEVGIRKTLGASVASIMTLFSREFVVLIFISFLIAAPTAYYIMDKWLENFAYRIQPGILTFLIGIVLSILVVLGTVGYVSYRAAVANPVLALKDE